MIWTLFITFLKIGLLSIGGGYAIIPLIREQVVAQNGWISEKVFTDIITISQMTPGPLAVNTSTFVGLRLSGAAGAVAATVGAVLGGIILSLLLYGFFRKHQRSAYVFEVLKGLKAASLGLIISAAAAMLLLAFFGTSGWTAGMPLDAAAVVLFAVMLVVLRKWRLNPILIMLLGGAAGLIFYM